MQRLTIGFLFASIFSVHAAVDLRKVLGSVTHVVDMYDAELDRVVPFRELRASLSVLDFLAQNYTGSGRGNINLAARLGYSAADDYYQAIDLMYTWCVKAEWSCNSIIEAEVELSKPKMLQLTKNMLQEGERQITVSLELLESVRDALTSMQSLLLPLPVELDLELEGTRRRYTSDRNQRMRRIGDKQWWRKAGTGAGVAASLVLAILGGPVGVGLGVIGAGLSVSIPPAVLNQQVEATAEQQLAIVETFLRSLHEAIQSTIDIIKVLREKARKEITHDQVLGGYTSESISLIELIDDYPLEETKKLKQTVSVFIKRHGGGKYSSRTRRETLSRDVRWEDISHAVDALLNVTAVEREVDYWTLKPLQAGSPADISHVTLM